MDRYMDRHSRDNVMLAVALGSLAAILVSFVAFASVAAIEIGQEVSDTQLMSDEVRLRGILIAILSLGGGLGAGSVAHRYFRPTPRY